MSDAYLFLECELIQLYDDFEENSLIAGRIVMAQVDVDHLRTTDRDDQDIMQQIPLLAYLNPGRYAQIQQTFSFPFHEGMQK